ncbi:MAG TPA: c-type cytochrome, partial [Nitrospiraceae bacterium]|nr:c-type cytochrome [Nitrospiraceae bacterium]
MRVLFLLALVVVASAISFRADAQKEASTVDSTGLGRETFESVGCSACHFVEKSATAVSSGPNLFGVFRREPQVREVVEGNGQHLRIKASREYLHRSIRSPAAQLAVRESGPSRGQSYPPAMPAFSAEVLSDAQIDAIYEYLVTLTESPQGSPVVKPEPVVPAAPPDPLANALEWLITDEVRVQRGPLPGVSGRSIHVGQPNGVHYTFDPRVLGVVRVWQGGFLNMAGELT